MMARAPGTLAITMAGLGSRFRSAGYACPKYRIDVLGRSLFDWSMLGLAAFRQAGWRFDFAMLATDDAQSFVRHRCTALGIQVGNIIELEGMTDGQATTALMLAQACDAVAPFAVFNIDTFVDPRALTIGDLPKDVDGWLPCFPGPGDAWSFVRTDADGRAVEVREKKRISPYATVGLYWFSSAAMYTTTYDRFFSNGLGVERNERYIAPMYNLMIEEGRNVTISHLTLDQVGMLGTPAQVENFETDPPASARRLMIAS
ncbi:MAG: glycosyltransferase family 2 protein [Sphingomonas sp.]|jgi:dTDP-glucose pyrophosphorylase|uniref:glycosyltransferase family 2 protein n=1 Tax=Sphingomonas sp. TaxID=28214 RepID=UPI00356747DE